MDKETLSNYGWIVICVLVLAVMIALAGPFGNFVADAVKSTTQGLFDVNQNALDTAGITIDGQGFAKSVYYGDLDKDGDIDENDKTILAEHIGEENIQTDVDTLRRMDLDGTGEVDMNDFVLISQYVGGKIDKFPVEDA